MTVTTKKTDDIEAPWLDQANKIITVDDCINALYLAGSLFLKEAEFNEKIKENPHSKYEYEKGRIIMNKLRENYERAKAIMEPTKPKLLTPRGGRK